MERIRINDIDNERYYQVPVSFFSNPFYKDMNSDTKIAYAILKNRLILSIKNNWIDNDGAVYIFYTQEKLAEILGISKRSVNSVISQLKEKSLIDVVRQGRGLPARIYVKKLMQNYFATTNDFIDEVPEPVLIKKEIIPTSNYEESFEKFWSAYPRKIGKGAAKKIWSKLKPSKELLEKMINSIEKFKNCRQWQEDNGKYIPNPSTWLNQERWLDEPPLEKTNKKTVKEYKGSYLPKSVDTAHKAIELLNKIGE